MSENKIFDLDCVMRVVNATRTDDNLPFTFYRDEREDKEIEKQR